MKSGPIILAALALFAAPLTACGKNEYAGFDDAKLERLSSAGDQKAVAERARRSQAAEAGRAAETARLAAEKATADAAAEAAGKTAFDAAKAANDNARLEELASAGNHRALFWRAQLRLGSDDSGTKQAGYDDMNAAADMGDADALMWVGFRRAQGIEGYPWNPSTGLQMVERSANLGNRDAMYAAGQIREYAGPLQDLAKAREWYQKAADAGSDAAKSRLAEMDAAASPRPD